MNNDDTERESQKWFDCTKCGAEVTDENWGAVLYDDHVGLSKHDSVNFCDDCRDDFEDWLESTSE